MIRAVIYDLDGTFFDSTEAIVASFFHTFETMGIAAPPRTKIVDSIGHILQDQFALLCDADPEECTRVYREHYPKIMYEKTHLLPGARESLDAFRAAGLRIGFATSKKRMYAEQLLEHLGVLGYFESRIGPDDVAKPKPDPEALHRSGENLGLGMDELVFIGDTDFDVNCAANAGVRMVAVTTGYNTGQELEALQPESVLDGLEQAAAHILANREALPV